MTKVVLVTGAQRGIGRAIARKAAALGFAVAVNFAEEQDEAIGLVAEIAAVGGLAEAFRGDVASVAEIDAVVAAVDRRFGRLDILVNNAGIFPRQPFLELTEETWDRTLAINLKGTCFASKAAAVLMVRGGEGGIIINLASAAVQGSVRGAHYSASKGGIVSLTRGVALELAPYRIRVNAIAPGLTNTRQPRDGMSEAEISETSASIPLGRMAEPDDIADLAGYLMSDASRMITGQVFHINGGTYRP